MKKLFCALAMPVVLFAPVMAETMTVSGTSYTITRTEQQLASGVKYTKILFPDRKITTNYTAGSCVHVVEADLSNPTVSVKHGDSGRDSRRSLTTQAANVSTSTAKCVAAANANFWITSEQPYNARLQYEPFGVSIKDGHMYSDPNTKTIAHVGGPTTTGMLAIDENGKCYIDYLKAQVGDQGVGSGWNYTITNTNPAHAHTFGLDQCNGVVCPGTAGVYTSIYGSSKTFRPVVSSQDYALSTGSSTEILMDFVSGTSEWNIGGETRLVIKEIRKNAGGGTLGSHDCAVVCRDSYASVANGWAVGDEMIITARVNFASVGSPNRIMQATSGNCITMANGVIGFNSSQNSYNNKYYARTLYGTNDAGSKLWIVVCEHYPNKTYTYGGFTTTEMTEILKNLGATWATQVDCGGSSQMYANGAQVSTSMDSGGVRNVQSGIFILSSAGADTEKPVIARCTTIANDTNSFYAYAYATDNIGVSKVLFPTWTENNGQDDLIWHEGVSGNWTVGGQTYNWRYLVNKSEHKNENGPYIVHVYAYDAANNSSSAGTSFTFETDTPEPVVSITANPESVTLSADFGATPQPYKDVTITAEGLTSDMSVASGTGMFTVTTQSDWNARTGGTLRFTLNTNFTALKTVDSYVAIVSGSNRLEVKVYGTLSDSEPTPETPTMNDNITELTEVWNYSEKSGVTTDWITTGSQVTQDMAFKDGKLYVVHRNGANTDNKIYIVDAYTGSKLGELPSSTCTSGTYYLSSIENFGGKIIAANLATSAESALMVYAWNDDSSEPTVLLNTTEHNGLRCGDALSVSGDMTNGKIWFGNATSVWYYTVTNGTCSTTPTIINLTKSGAAYTNSGSAAENITVESDGSFWVDSKDYTPAHFNASGEFIETTSAVNIGATDIKFITLGSKKYAAVMTYLNTSATTLANGAFKLLNATDGISTATEVGTYPSAGLGTSSRNTSNRNTLCYEVNDTDFNIWVLVPFQGAAYYKFQYSTPTGIENIEVEDNVKEPIEWYNLQGIRVNGENLNSGIYIRRQGNDVKKIIVK